MNLRRTLAIARRIAEFFRRDHRTLALMFVAPIVIMGLLGWVIRDEKPPVSTVAIVNDAGPGGAPVLGRVSDALTQSGFTVRSDITTDDAARSALRAGTIDIGLLFSLDSGGPRVVIVTPGLNPADDSSRVGGLRGALASAFSTGGPIIEQQTIYNATGTFFDAFAPALVGFVVFFLVFILTGISFLRERVGGTLERLLATPVRRSEIVVGYSLGFALFATLQVALVLLFVLGTIHIGAVGPLPEINLGLGVPIAGSPWLAFVITLLLAISAVNLGIFLSTFARTEFQILQFIPLVIVPQALLAGIFWPISTLPDVLMPIARLMPMTYGIEGLREVLIKGAGLESGTVQLDIVVLAGIAVLLAVIATLTIRREVA
ncbi:MAG TPA: ABC transporter permease [Candidatus Limnocylindrales bacterium]